MPWLYGVCAVVSAIILGPLLGSLFGRGHWLYRDAVSTPRSHPTDTALGVDGAPPRAVPQDWLLAITGRLIDGGIVTAALTFAALMFAGVGYGRLAARLVPGAGRAGPVVAAVVSIWNPFVAERLLQGHWSLLVSFAALGWLICALGDALDSPTPRRWVIVAGLMACAGFTPTGSVLAAAVTLTVLLSRWPRGSRHTAPATGVLWAIGTWIIGALPWLTAALIGETAGTSGSAGVAAFGVRVEAGLEVLNGWGPLNVVGTAGTLAGLGGIWNADAVPASRSSAWAVVATLALLVVVIAGTVEFLRRRREFRSPTTALAVLAAVALLVLVATTTSFGHDAWSWLIESVPGAGLLRDAHKYAALLVPFYAVAACAAIVAARRWVPAWFAVGAALLLVVAPLPDLTWGAGGTLTTVTYPAEFADAVDLIDAGSGAAVLYPPGPVRDYSFADGPSLDPLPRMLRVPVLGSGRLSVDGVQTDAPAGPGMRAEEILESGGSVGQLAELGVGWVIVEDASTPAALDGLAPAFASDGLRVYRLPGVIAELDVDPAARAASIAAHTIWLLAVVTAALAAVRRPTAAAARFRRSSADRRSRHETE